MPYIYRQSTGVLTQDGVLVTTAYSGHGDGLNNPVLQDTPRVGPIPMGLYTIEEALDDPETGPISMRLTPAPDNNMYGRSAFLIHGDNPAMNHSASEGCIIAAHDARVHVASGLDTDNQLVVTA